MNIKALIFIMIIAVSIAATGYDLWRTPQMNITTTDDISHQKAPDFSFATQDGQNYQLGALKEKIVLLHFWASWCLPCAAEFPMLLELIEEFNSDVALIAVSIDETEADIEKFKSRLKASNKSVYWVWDKDKDISLKTFNTIKVPETFFIDKELNIIHKTAGETDWQSLEIKNILGHTATTPY